MSGPQEGDDSFLRLKINCMPLGMLGRKFSADVKRARDVHSQVIERRGVIKDDQFIGSILLRVEK